MDAGVDDGDGLSNFCIESFPADLWIGTHVHIVPEGAARADGLDSNVVRLIGVFILRQEDNDLVVVDGIKGRVGRVCDRELQCQVQSSIGPNAVAHPGGSSFDRAIRVECLIIDICPVQKGPSNALRTAQLRYYAKY